MLFNSHIFIALFLPITFLLYFGLSTYKSTTWAKYSLVLTSLFFYSWWNPLYLPLILCSLIINYTLGRLFEKHKEKAYKKKGLLYLGLIFNLGLLGYFKYYDFFIQNLNTILSTHIPLKHLMLPLAISFFTFQQIAYLIDAYQNKTTEYNFLNYCLFITFFPQLIAGPIVHHKEMMPQFETQKNTKNETPDTHLMQQSMVNGSRICAENCAKALFIFSIGLFKKVCIADQFSVWATAGFDVAPTLSFFSAWFTSLSYTLQLYFDFSGYTDMAIGSALLFNIVLPQNFNSPYKASSIQAFWRRWHMTLSRFLKEYIYIPLGGNRLGQTRLLVNLFLTFLLGGIWHGAGWTFVFWGALHGLGVVFHRFWQNTSFKIPRILGIAMTFLFVNLTWIFFRAQSLNDALKLIKGMTGQNGITLPAFLENKLSFLTHFGIEFGRFVGDIQGTMLTPVWIIAGLILVFGFKNSSEKLNTFKPTISTLLFSGILFLISFLSMHRVSEFLYFDF